MYRIVKFGIYNNPTHATLSLNKKLDQIFVQRN